MDAKQVEIVDVLVYDLGHTIIQIDGDRFFVGTIEIPDHNQRHCQLLGQEISHFFKVEALRKTAEQLKAEVTTFINNTRPIAIKFNVNTDWYSYSM